MGIAEKPQANDWNQVVADNIRAELSRERWSGRKAAAALGVTPNWITRRLSGETPLDPNDIVMFARFLNVPIEDLFRAKQNGPTPEGTGPRLLPELDSNQQPAGNESAPENSDSYGKLIDITRERHRRATPTRITGVIARVTPIRGIN